MDAGTVALTGYSHLRLKSACNDFGHPACKPAPHRFQGPRSRSLVRRGDVTQISISDRHAELSTTLFKIVTSERDVAARRAPELEASLLDRAPLRRLPRRLTRRAHLLQ